MASQVPLSRIENQIVNILNAGQEWTPEDLADRMSKSGNRLTKEQAAATLADLDKRRIVYFVGGRAKIK